jgi:hypothetical protein
MPSPKKIRQQMERLTAELVGLSLCDRQNFPAMKNLGQGYCEVLKNDTFIPEQVHFMRLAEVFQSLNSLNA